MKTVKVKFVALVSGVKSFDLTKRYNIPSGKDPFEWISGVIAAIDNLDKKRSKKK